MIAKIGRSTNLFATLSYNNIKIEKEKGEILLMSKMIETADGKYSVSQLAKSFEPYLVANRNTEKYTLHISLNPDPKDKVSDEQYRKIAQHYMEEMGYGNQPFIVFKHTDTGRSHIHIVSVCVDEQGKKISDKFEKIKSMNICRELERMHGLIPATDKERSQNDKIFRPVDYRAGDIKSQMASVIRHLPAHYQFQSLGEYNALLSLFNLTAEKVEGKLHGKMKRGLLYFPLNNKGQKTGNPFKSSLFGKNAGIESLEKRFDVFKTTMKNNTIKNTLRSDIINALETSKNERSFRKNLAKRGIDTVARRNDQGRIYGITFIDHPSKTVWNGSRLGKECSASVFNDYWNNNIKSETREPTVKQPNISVSNTTGLFAEKLHHLFDLLNISERPEEGLMEALGGLLPGAEGEEYQEQPLANTMRKRKKRRRS